MSCLREERAKVKKLAGTRAFWILHAATLGMWPAFWLRGNPDVYVHVSKCDVSAHVTNGYRWRLW